MALGDEVALSSDPPSEEEAELVDPQDTLKASCSGGCEQYRAVLEKCNDRVNSRSNTAEMCVEELFDFVHCVDSCVSKELFKHLK
ncbi:cytochrome b-c1 complex subunit 6, mitochondrial-like [Gigantopelta aegis]|uniref:cytochrome b-c1 complex subunit 6, mitochondrial-like n=1 Tax=Gigantopelta aegis TaxID=1735272 RepID=UPI001B88D805|nr:cytochrome b-c1 complex subunit 6, mitochondrial-like [Gigantopelta aegis]